MKRISGYSLMMAIVLVIIVTAVSYSIILLFDFSNQRIINTEKIVKASQFSFESIDNTSKIGFYDIPLIVELEEGLKLSTIRKRWGAFDYCISSIISNNDTLINRIALIGSKNVDSGIISVFLRKTNSIVTIGDNCFIANQCYFPQGIVQFSSNKPENLFGNLTVRNSSDTLLSLNEYDSVCFWIQKHSQISDIRDRSLTIDSLSNSFLNPLLIINADTVIVSGNISGNILINSFVVIVKPQVRIQDVVILSNEVYFSDYFTGNLQVYAKKKIFVGSSSSFEYPSVLAIYPDLSSENDNIANNYGIYSEGDFKIDGEVICYSTNYSISRKMNVSLKGYSVIQGGIYCSGSVFFNGKCYGSVICENIYGIRGGMLKNNFLNNITIGELRNEYVFSNLFPGGKNKKIVEWLK